MVDLSTDLMASFFNQFFQTADFSLHLLQIGPGIRKVGSGRVDLFLLIDIVALNAALFSLEHLHAFRLDAGRNTYNRKGRGDDNTDSKSLKRAGRFQIHTDLLQEAARGGATTKRTRRFCRQQLSLLSMQAGISSP